MCLGEGTNLSEGRGTCRPFEQFGAPWLDSDERWWRGWSARALPGVRFRPVAFTPTFDKHRGVSCCGRLHPRDRPRRRFQPLLTGIAVLQMARELGGENFAWRADAYEFVEDVPAFDLLCGSDQVRRGIEEGWPLSRLVEGFEAQSERFQKKRQALPALPVARRRLVIGIFSDSHGDLDAFDSAFELLKAKGARRFFFTGGDYQDLDDWFMYRRERVREARDYTDEHFLRTCAAWLSEGEQVERPPAFWGHAEVQRQLEEELVKVRGRFVRACEKDTARYRSSGPAQVGGHGGRHPLLPRPRQERSGAGRSGERHDLHPRQGAASRRWCRSARATSSRRGGCAAATEQSCALLEKVDKNVKVSMFALDGRTLLDGQVLQLDRRDEVSVK